MKKTPLVRKTPLRRKRPMKQWRRPDEDKVTPDLYAYIMERDKNCIFKGLPDHRCQGRLTEDHVPDEGENAFGVRAKSDRWHLVVVCAVANTDGYASAHRDFERDYLAKKEPR